MRKYVGNKIDEQLEQLKKINENVVTEYYNKILPYFRDTSNFKVITIDNLEKLKKNYKFII
ncbi:MAG: hypothetical protein ACK5LY_00150 [Lachnospirales bacterium]